MSAFKAAAIVLAVSLRVNAGDPVKLWATDKVCPALKTAVSQIGQVPFPPGWTVLVACNEVQWSMLQRKGDAQATGHAFTNVKGKVTVVRGALFTSRMGNRVVRRVLLHEIGHIECNCGDEAKAEAWASAHERGRGGGAR